MAKKCAKCGKEIKKSKNINPELCLTCEEKGYKICKCLVCQKTIIRKKGDNYNHPNCNKANDGISPLAEPLGSGNSRKLTNIPPQ